MKRIARFVAVTCAALTLGAVVRAQQADTPTNPFAKDPTAAAAGKTLFEGTCAVCHGSGGTGGRGPALNSGRFSHGDDDYDLFKVIHDGVRGTEMPSFAALPANDIWKAVSYIRSLAASAATPAGGPQAAVASAGGATTGDAARGQQLFFGSGACAACHEVNGRGSTAGPDLSAEAGRGAAAIRSAIVHPTPRGFNAMAGRWVNLVTSDGRSVSGMVRAEDSFTTILRFEDGGIETFNRASLKSYADDPAPRARMAAVAQMSDTQREDLVAFLLQQKARNVSNAIEPSTKGTLTAERLAKAKSEPGSWLTYWGGYDAHHFSELNQINTGNVHQLQAKWAAQLPGQAQLKAQPIVVDGVIYMAGSPGEVQALDARTGLQLWKFTRKQDVTNPYQINLGNRGVAVLDGRVFVGTMDDLLIAIDAATGRELWERRTADTLEGFEMTGAPLALPGKIIVGYGNGEFGTRGMLDAYDPATGKLLWRFNTIPGPGEAGHDSWAGDSWKLGGGGTWLTGSYDVETDTLIWAVGNPAPSFNNRIRAGDNLYTNSVIALDPNTGKLKWHYQFTPNDSHDWDSEEAMVLANGLIDGKPRKLLLHADRNGMYYVLDRTNGHFIRSVPFVRQTWNEGFDATGRPKVIASSDPTNTGTSAYPAVGGTNWQAPSYDQKNQRFFVVFSDSAATLASEEPKFEKGKQYVAGRRMGSPSGTVAIQGVQAMDALTGKQLWRFPLVRSSLSAGLLATRGGIVLAASADGNFIALDAVTGKALWRFATGGGIGSSPISYAIDGRQFIAIAAGTTLYAFALPDGPRP